MAKVQQGRQQPVPRYGMWIAAGLFSAVLAVSIGGAVKIDGQPLVENPSTIIVQIVASAGLVLAGALPLLRRADRNASVAARDAGIAREQVQNAHSTNLREESDDRHGDVTSRLDSLAGSIETVVTTLETVMATQRGMARDVGRNADGQISLGNRVNLMAEKQSVLVDAIHQMQQDDAREKLEALRRKLSDPDEGETHG